MRLYSWIETNKDQVHFSTRNTKNEKFTFFASVYKPGKYMPLYGKKDRYLSFDAALKVILSYEKR